MGLAGPRFLSGLVRVELINDFTGKSTLLSKSKMIVLAD